MRSIQPDSCMQNLLLRVQGISAVYRMEMMNCRKYQKEKALTFVKTLIFRNAMMLGSKALKIEP